MNGHGEFRTTFFLYRVNIHWSLNLIHKLAGAGVEDNSAATMLPILSIISLVGLLTSFTYATALTYKLAPNERECFYTWVNQKDAKIAFYFAVQSGGSFDSKWFLIGICFVEHLGILTRLAVDYKVTGPGNEPGKDRVILEGEKERQGDFVFTATSGGEYRFCFDNSVSTFSDKIVDFEISVS